MFAEKSLQRFPPAHKEPRQEYRIPLFLCFVDLNKAYDTVNRQAMAAILKEYGVPHQLVIEELHSETWCQVRFAGDTSERFEVTTGVRQGCALSHLLFNCFLDKVLREAMTTLNGSLNIDYTMSVPHVLGQDSGINLHLGDPVCG